MKGQQQRCGFVALLGAPNAGKSTLLNTIVGAKVSIVTPKVQTTRMRILGVSIVGDAQLVFIDTPGIFTPKRRLDRAMVAAAWGGASDSDVILLLIDAKTGIDRDTRRIINGLKESNRPAVCVLNKIDTVKRSSLLALTDNLVSENIFTDFFMISALNGDGVEDLRCELAGRLLEGPWHFPEDQLSDMNDRLFAAEITREKLYLNLYQELPYALTVETETWEPFDNGAVKVEQVIFVERDRQKGIVLGKGGELIKRVRKLAQEELKDILERDVHLFLFVKVRENWGDDPERYRDWGLDFSR
ncbi:MAG TPA: GTPase Era [Rhodospirillaceae bacterium]|nr:GTPase Era [Rhodospirillaceae bacterium]|tara:strand:- start:129 stop:1031 length:903 start_codon:yes stop_codon:yes gene_type:complete